MIQTEGKPEFVDGPEVSNVFADIVRLIAVVDGVVHIELCASKFEEPRAGQPLVRKFQTSARLTLTMPAMLSLHEQLGRNLNELEKQGLLKRTPTDAAPGAPKH